MNECLSWNTRSSGASRRERSHLLVIICVAIVCAPLRPVRGAELSGADLAARVAKRGSLSERSAREAIDLIAQAISEAVIAGDDVWIFGLGRFEVQLRRLRSAAGGDRPAEPRRKVLRFVPSDELRMRLAASGSGGSGRAP